MGFPEEFLHFIWQFKLYDSRKLFSRAGEVIEVIDPGLLHKNGGPDFSTAKLRIANRLWIGHVEIHLKSSDWLLHRHHLDGAYENVILHVVYVDDKPIYRKDGSVIPVLVLKGLFPMQLLSNYQQLIKAIHSFPCEKQIGGVDALFTHLFLSRVLIERLEEKTKAIEEKLKELKGNWDEAYYHFMARSFGFKLNAMPMEMLARSLPQQLFAKHKDHPLQIEALLFGQAGFLDQQFKEGYPNSLKREYQFLKKKYGLCPLDPALWKFLRMRPQNFPTLRLAQFAALIVNSNHLFSKTLKLHPDEQKKIFQKLPVHPFWKNHYHFNKQTKLVNLQLSSMSINNLLINTNSLFLFAYGKYVGNESLMDKGITLLTNLPAENNAITKQYVVAGVKLKTAYESQALLQLKKKYCNEKKCLNCGIGVKILKP